MMEFLEQDARDLVESELSVAGALQPAGGGAAVEIRGIFRSPYNAEKLGDLSAGGGAYRFHCLSEDLAGVNARRGTLTITGKIYRVQEPKADELAPGWTTLYLGA
ncbi:hypothetical protein [Desulfuromonas sp. TF]|uniref:head-tail joining protein n=1 Tax=Desulfuromonas sp. TF TaxID=1232410 RepID=UPI00041B336B|nr:hypothetical protein [Desulfuromonas sp. TF]